MIGFGQLKNAEVVVDNMWLKYEFYTYIKYITDPNHGCKFSNYYYMRVVKQYEKDIKNAINKGEIIL